MHLSDLMDRIDREYSAHGESALFSRLVDQYEAIEEDEYRDALRAEFECEAFGPDDSPSDAGGL